MVTDRRALVEAGIVQNDHSADTGNVIPGMFLAKVKCLKTKV